MVRTCLTQFCLLAYIFVSSITVMGGCLLTFVLGDRDGLYLAWVWGGFVHGWVWVVDTNIVCKCMYVCVSSLLCFLSGPVWGLVFTVPRF